MVLQKLPTSGFFQCCTKKKFFFSFFLIQFIFSTRCREKKNWGEENKRISKKKNLLWNRHPHQKKIFIVYCSTQVFILHTNKKKIVTNSPFFSLKYFSTYKLMDYSGERRNKKSFWKKNFFSSGAFFLCRWDFFFKELVIQWSHDEKLMMVRQHLIYGHMYVVCIYFCGLIYSSYNFFFSGRKTAEGEKGAMH